ncbi:sensor histidine kinase YkoH [Jeotgalicoccus coquinae]|uniref:histidine kinase n=1 Tax=Jeotgalicoccus coquinae TaxID=709509 RepID=A0A6V7R443_9STAP|nr:HAMP domain-containing sensor histidine kinase [Jeotgalicoccus coquinae]MBB6423457.1 signal transduction histidine kinase [Jeotgalicoccus coquinae]GGE20023.1 sensor histidine kinase YkoH [Jeotgalicoccus coquinae]CAD2071682.1 Signal transduction histidine-protein kinase ArlS [Jeotgalicoccus coquinae]
MKLGTKIQLYTTVMIAIVVVLTNLLIYFAYKHYSLEAEMGQLENRGNNIITEIQQAEESGISGETVLQYFSLSDGYITMLNEQQEHIVRIATEESYLELAKPYSTSQYTDSVSFNGENFVMVSMPVIWENGEVHSLQIYENVYFLYDTYNILKWILIISTIILLVLVFVLNQFITNLITSPIKQLVRRMSDRENVRRYKTIPVSKSDTLELKMLTDSYNDMMLTLKAHDDNQQAFIMNASHELKTPLTVISSYARMLERFGKTREDLLDEGITAISEETTRMKYLTEQFLSFTKVTHSDTNAEKEHIPAVKLIESIASRLEKVFKRNINIDSGGTNPYVYVHPPAFEQLLRIFLDNAYKYSTDDIDVSVDETEKSVIVAVTDYGIGIPKEDLNGIFTRFYRVDKARTRKTGGSGLGLSIAKQLAENNDMDISVKSIVNEGTTFTLTMKKEADNGEAE